MIQPKLLSLIDLGITLFCVLAWVFLPQFGWIILIISLLPLALRFFLGQFPFRITSLDISIGVFLITAGVGVWAAFDQTAALEKFWWIVAACRLYYALATQPRENFWSAAISISALAALFSILFLTTFDWTAHPLDVSFVNIIGNSWARIRPTVNILAPKPDFIGGVTALLLPLISTMAYISKQQKNNFRLGISLLLSCILILGLVMSAERPAWFGLILILGLWAGWQICKRISHRIGSSPFTVVILALAIITIGGVVLLSQTWQQIAGLGSGRIEEIVNGSQLVLSYPILGGGLTSVSGLYSRYILNIQYLFIPYISNQYLNIAIEQGLFGLGSFIVIFMVTLIDLIKKNQTKTRAFPTLDWAIVAGIIIFASHSLVEDVLYNSWSLIFLFTLSGLAVILFQDSTTVKTSRKWVLASLGIISIVLIVFITPLRSTWFANVGAVQMARVQLQGWPDQRITGEELLSQINIAETSFEQSIKINPNQPTANYRVGLIATERRDFESANNHFTIAFGKRPYHRGIRKALGYNYAWLGEIEFAGTILSTIPEAPYELGIYTQWWKDENCSDLSRYAIQTKNWIEQQ